VVASTSTVVDFKGLTIPKGRCFDNDDTFEDDEGLTKDAGTKALLLCVAARAAMATVTADVENFMVTTVNV
jgi:hypothetical protein